MDQRDCIREVYCRVEDVKYSRWDGSADTLRGSWQHKVAIGFGKIFHEDFEKRGLHARIVCTKKRFSYGKASRMDDL